MSKIKIICDSTCDMSKEKAKELNVTVVPLTIIIEDKQYLDGIDFEQNEFYDILDKCKELPSTSQVTPEQFFTEYEKAYADGFESVITVTINSKASGTFQSAQIAKNFFVEKYGEQMSIDVVDSGTYTHLISIGVYEAVNMVNEGKNVAEILSFLESLYKNVTAFAAVSSLEILIKKGRISSFTGLVGGILNIKPIIKIGDSEIKSTDKVRGNAAIVPKLIELCEKEMDDSFPYLIAICCRDCPEFTQLKQTLAEKFPSKTIIVGHLGSVIALNIGTYVVGLGFVSKK